MRDKMRISAPNAWLDEIDLECVASELQSLGFTPLAQVRHWWCCEDRQCCLSPREYGDWRARLLETVEAIADERGITAAEWFAEYFSRRESSRSVAHTAR